MNFYELDRTDRCDRNVSSDRQFSCDRHQDRILLWKTGLACVRGDRDFFPARLSPDLKYDHQRADRCFRDHLHLEHQGII